MAYAGFAQASPMQAVQANPLATVMDGRNIRIVALSPGLQNVLTTDFLYLTLPLLMRPTVPRDFNLGWNAARYSAVVDACRDRAADETMTSYEWFLYYAERFWPDGDVDPLGRPTGVRRLYHQNFANFLVRPELRSALNPALQPYTAATYQTSLTAVERTELRNRDLPGFTIEPTTHTARYGPAYALVFSSRTLDGHSEHVAAVVAASLLHQRLVLAAAAASVVPDLDLRLAPGGRYFALDPAFEIPVLVVAGPRYRGCTMRVATRPDIPGIGSGEPVIYELRRTIPTADMREDARHVERFADWIFAAHYRGAVSHRNRAMRDARDVLRRPAWASEGPLERPERLRFVYDRVVNGTWQLRVQRQDAA